MGRRCRNGWTVAIARRRALVLLEIVEVPLPWVLAATRLWWHYRLPARRRRCSGSRRLSLRGRSGRRCRLCCKGRLINRRTGVLLHVPQIPLFHRLARGRVIKGGCLGRQGQKPQGNSCQEQRHGLLKQFHAFPSPELVHTLCFELYSRTKKWRNR